jgi:HEPN domain-containing protein
MQQCVEKYLKAFLIFHGKEIRKTHIIEELIRECIEIDSSFQQLFEIKAHTLTDFAVELRYPSDVSLPSNEETEEAIEITKKVRQFVLKKLEEKGFK